MKSIMNDDLRISFGLERTIGIIEANEGGKASSSDLWKAFIWKYSPQPHPYWFNRANDLEEGKPLSKTAIRHLERMVKAYEKEET